MAETRKMKGVSPTTHGSQIEVIADLRRKFFLSMISSGFSLLASSTRCSSTYDLKFDVEWRCLNTTASSDIFLCLSLVVFFSWQQVANFNEAKTVTKQIEFPMKMYLEKNYSNT